MATRIACGIDLVGTCNFLTSRAYRRDVRRVELGHERDRALFVLQGLDDPRVPSSESEQIVKTVRENTVWYLPARDEGRIATTRGTP